MSSSLQGQGGKEGTSSDRKRTKEGGRDSQQPRGIKETESPGLGNRRKRALTSPPRQESVSRL